MFVFTPSPLKPNKCNKQWWNHRALTRSILGKVTKFGVHCFMPSKLLRASRATQSVSIARTTQNTKIRKPWVTYVYTCRYSWLVFVLVTLPQFDLFCDRGSLGFVSTSVFFAGFFVGSIVVSPFSDKFGRKRPLFICGFFCWLFSFVSAFAPAFWVFALCRAIVGFMVGKYYWDPNCESCLILNFLSNYQLKLSNKLQ